MGVLSCFWPMSVLAKWDSYPQESLEAKLTGVFVHKESAVFIGQKFLQNVPNEANITLLVDLIGLRQPDWRSRLARCDKKELQRIIIQQQKLDFEYDRIETIEGWVLSKTEVRLCAIASLLRHCQLNGQGAH